MSHKRTATFLSVFALAAILVGMFAMPSPAYAWQTGGDVSCGGAFARIKNNNTPHYWDGSVRVNGVVVFSDSGTVGRNQWARIDWTPPTGTVGSVSVTIRILDNSFRVLDSHTVRGVLNCVPDYQLNLSHVECVDDEPGGNNVEVHFVLLNVPDGITPGTLTYTYGSIPPGAHTGNVWHYTAHLPDGSYNITSASVNVGGVTVTLHNPGDYAGDYFCGPQHDYSVRSHQSADCDGYQRVVNLYDNGQLVATLFNIQGNWTDPAHYEVLPGVTFDVPDQYGIPDVVFDDLPEPAVCHDFNVTTFTDSDCDGWIQKVLLYDGGQLITVLDSRSGQWSDPYTLEVAPGWTFNVPTEYGGGTIDVSQAVEPDSCVIVRTYKAHQAYLSNSCDGVRRVINLYEGPPSNPFQTLVGTLYNEVFDFTNPFALEVAPEITVDVPDEYGSDYTFPAMYEPDDCQVSHQTDVWFRSDCNQYWGGYILDGNQVETFRGNWTDPYRPESVTVDVLVPIGEGELGDRSFTITIEKDSTCLQCLVEKVYPMASYIAYDAPPGYWQGPFGMGPGVCSVIHPAGQVPAAWRISDVCSLCPEQIEGGYLYDIRNGNGRMFYDGWVYKVTCYGQEPYYTYMGYRWDNWVRLGEFTQDGERTSCRVDWCTDWVHENYPNPD